MNYYGHMIPRINGDDIEREFSSHRDLVKKGIAGFILFGGERENVRNHLRLLQNEVPHPLIICSDLEQGLGQQLRGGTVFPPAMALSAAVARDDRFDRELAHEIFSVYAEEALSAGINTILAPVVDINTNPENPIISVRSFGEDRETVTRMSAVMIDAFRSHSVKSCAKHFPGHGDTMVDSHISLPLLNKSLDTLEQEELYPFRRALEEGADSIMLAHLSVPALDPEGVPLSLSGKAVQYIRQRMGFQGLLMTDALNMGGLSDIGENEAGFKSLTAGVDVLLHPGDPEGLNAYLMKRNPKSDLHRIEAFRSNLSKGKAALPDFEKNRRLAEKIAELCITVPESIRIGKPSSIIILRERDEFSFGIFEEFLRERYPDVRQIILKGEGIPGANETGENAFILIYSKTAAWKGGVSPWFREAIRGIEKRTALFIVFGNPYVVRDTKSSKVLTYWCSEQAERALVKSLEKFLFV